MEVLYCYKNQITELPDLSKCKNLTHLECSSNNLIELPDLTKCKNLTELNCDNNNLPYDDLEEYIEWHKKTYPWIWNSEKYNL